MYGYLWSNMTLLLSVQVSAVLSNMTLLEEKCAEGTLAAYVSVNGTISDFTEALQEVMCINPQSLAEALYTQINMDQFQQEVCCHVKPL